VQPEVHTEVPKAEDTMRLNPDGTITLLLDRCFCTITRSGEFAGQTFDVGWKTCPKCKGTGKRGNGKCRACTGESYEKWKKAGQIKDYDNVFATGVCPQCNGTLKVPTSYTAETPAWIVATIPVVMIGQDRDLSWGESHLGMASGFHNNSLGAVVDYGRRLKQLADGEMTIPEMTAKIRDEIIDDRVQLCKIITDRDTMRLAKTLVILMTRTGYSIVATDQEFPA
jgi:RecJ-like exonuclease